jgi:hypothetical protein
MRQHHTAFSIDYDPTVMTTTIIIVRMALPIWVLSYPSGTMVRVV